MEQVLKTFSMVRPLKLVVSSPREVLKRLIISIFAPPTSYCLEHQMNMFIMGKCSHYVGFFCREFKAQIAHIRHGGRSRNVLSKSKNEAKSSKVYKNTRKSEKKLTGNTARFDLTFMLQLYVLGIKL